MPIDAGGGGLHRRHRAAELGIVGNEAGQPVQLQAQPAHLLPELVVHVARDPLTLALYRGQRLAHELGVAAPQRFAVGLELPLLGDVDEGDEQHLGLGPNARAGPAGELHRPQPGGGVQRQLDGPAVIAREAAALPQVAQEGRSPGLADEAQDRQPDQRFPLHAQEGRRAEVDLAHEPAGVERHVAVRPEVVELDVPVAHLLERGHRGDELLVLRAQLLLVNGQLVLQLRRVGGHRAARVHASAGGPCGHGCGQEGGEAGGSGASSSSRLDGLS